MKLTKRQFRAQWVHEITWADLAGNIDKLVYHGHYYGYKIYRLLEKLVLEDNGRFFLSSIN